MHYCPDNGCEYRTPHSKNLRRHVAKTGHGNTAKKRQFKGHMSTPKKKNKRKHA